MLLLRRLAQNRVSISVRVEGTTDSCSCLMLKCVDLQLDFLVSFCDIRCMITSHHIRYNHFFEKKQHKFINKAQTTETSMLAGPSYAYLYLQIYVLVFGSVRANTAKMMLQLPDNNHRFAALQRVITSLFGSLCRAHALQINFAQACAGAQICRTCHVNFGPAYAIKHFDIQQRTHLRPSPGKTVSKLPKYCDMTNLHNTCKTNTTTTRLTRGIASECSVNINTADGGGKESTYLWFLQQHLKPTYWATHKTTTPCPIHEALCSATNNATMPNDVKPFCTIASAGTKAQFWPLHQTKTGTSAVL